MTSIDFPSVPDRQHLSLRRVRLLRIFLWLSVIGCGIGLGAKLFDLLVLASAWGAAPPQSFSLMPYGKAYPVDPGDLFQPLSALLLVGSVGALVTGWRAPRAYRTWLLLPVLMLAVIWVLTPTIFWPMINEMWAAAKGRLLLDDAHARAVTYRWFVWDGLRTALIATGFVSSVQAMSAGHRHGIR